MNNYMYLVPIAAVIALLFAAYLAGKVGKQDAGTDRMKEIAGAIAEGARAFLMAEYKILVIFVVVLFVLIGFGISWVTAVCFVIGALFSTVAGYCGMTVATKANVRTAMLGLRLLGLIAVRRRSQRHRFEIRHVESTKIKILMRQIVVAHRSPFRCTFMANIR